MNSYIYKAINSQGRMLKGKCIVDNEIQLINIVNSKGLYLIDYKLLKSKSLSKSIHKITSKDLALLCRQLYQVLKCGINFSQGIKLLVNEKLNLTIRNCLFNISNDIEKGKGISESFSKFPEVFPKFMIQLIHVGEQCGNLEHVFFKLSEYYVKQHKLSKKIGSMLMYPLAVLITTIIISIFIITKIIPGLVGTFSDSTQSIPSNVKKLLFLNELFSTIHFKALLGITIFIVYYIYLKGYHKKIFYRIQYKLPVIKGVFLEINEIHFARNLRLLINSGLTIISSLEIIRDSSDSIYIKGIMDEIINSIRSGESLSNSLSNSKVFKNMFIYMVSIGEETGSLDDMLNSIADIYENNINETISRVTKLVEPIVIISLTIIILIMIFNLILPLFDVIYSIDALN